MAMMVMMMMMMVLLPRMMSWWVKSGKKAGPKVGGNGLWGRQFDLAISHAALQYTAGISLKDLFLPYINYSI